MKKTKLLLATTIVSAGCFVGTKLINNHQKDDTNTIAELRSKHENFLKNSPLNESLQWDKKERKQRGLTPNRYYEQMQLLTMNPATGKMEDGNLSELRQELLSQRTNRRGRMNPGDKGNSWVERGPNNVGGRTRVVLFDPNDPTNKRVYAGGVSGGLWKNNDITNPNSQWGRVQNVPGNLSVTSISIDPRNSKVWYIGTGEQYTAGDVVGNGVYTTRDGGNSWTPLNITPQDSGDNISYKFDIFHSGIYYVNDVLAWDNGASTELFVAVGSHIYGDSSSPRDWLGLQSSGLYHSVNNGETWTRIETSNMRYQYSGKDYYYTPNDLEVDINNRIWMGTISSPIPNSGGGRVFSSVDGANWVEAPASPLRQSNRVELEVSASNPNKLYALTEGNRGTPPVNIFKTEDAFNTVIETPLPNDADPGIPANDFCRGQAFYDLVIEADPTNDEIVYVGGINLFKSIDGGNNWLQQSHWYGGFDYQYVHADQHCIAFGNNDPSKMLFGNDGGIYYSENASTDIGMRNHGYNVTQFVKAGIGPDGTIADNPTQKEIFTAGAQDNGTQGFRNPIQGINSSSQVSDGDGFYTFVDKDGEYMISTYVYNYIYKFKLPWDGRGRLQGGATYLYRDGRSGQFVNPMDLDSDANRLLTDASTRSYTAILSIDVAKDTVNGKLYNRLLTAAPTAFRASPFTENRWFVGLRNGRLLKLSNVTDTTADWEAINVPFVGSVSSVRFGSSEDDIFVTIHNYGVTSIWSTNDGGANWVSKEGDLPNIPVRDFLQNPLNRSEAIIATQLGVWSTKNFDSENPNWRQAYNGMSDVSVTSFDYWNVSGDHTKNKVIASTYGRGVFTSSFSGNGQSNYCVPSNGDSTDAWIEYVSIDGVSCRSTRNLEAYEFFAYEPIPLTEGKKFSLEVNGKSIYRVFYTVWIDFNKDGKFTKEEAIKWLEPSHNHYNNNRNIIDDLEIPYGVEAGQTRMRILINRDYHFNNLCDSRYLGEVEDYLINIKPNSNRKSEQVDVKSPSEEKVELSVYPNPATSVIYLNNSYNNKNLPYTIVDLTGKEIRNGTVSASGINVDDLKSGAYFIKVQNGDKIISKRIIKK